MQHYTFLLFLVFLGTSIANAQTKPPQPSTGPGGATYSHGGVTTYFKDSASLSYWIFQPNQPTPDSADLVIFNHGYGQINPMVHAEWITHLVRKGSIVVYPKYQDDLNTPADSFMFNASEAIKLAIQEMQQPNYVAPKLQNFAMIGHSYGGAISANLTYEYQTYNLPRVKALMVAQGYHGNDMLLPSYRDFPYDTKMQLVVGENDGVVGNTFARLLMDSANVDPLFKNYITHSVDNHGNPGVNAAHDEPICISPNQDYDSGESNVWVQGAQFFNRVDAVDFFCYWKLSQALLDCTFRGQNCNYAFGDTPEQRHMGVWSDGTPVKELDIEPKDPNAIQTIHNAAVQWNITPNPTSNSITIQCNDIYTRSDLFLYNSLGTLVATYPAFQMNTTSEIILPKASGIYYLVLQTEKGFSSQKVVKH